MAKIMCLYLDDLVNGNPTLINFAIGSDWAACSSTKKMEPIARSAHADFCKRWEIKVPLHSFDIR